MSEPYACHCGGMVDGAVLSSVHWSDAPVTPDLVRREALHEEPPRVRHGPDEEVAAERAGEAAAPARGLVHVPEARRVGGAEQAFGGAGGHDRDEVVEEAGQHGHQPTTRVILHIST